MALLHNPAVHPVAFSVQFRGQSTPLSPGVLTTRATAPSSAVVTKIRGDGVRGTFERADGGEAHLECLLTFLDDSRFDEVGTISFGHGNTLRLRTVGQGTIAPSCDRNLRQGTAAWEIDGGAGGFAGATRRIVSNFLGDLTDHQLGVVFLPDEPGPESDIDRGEAL